MIKFTQLKEILILCALFILGVLILFMRNSDVVLYPTMYAEDGKWAAIGLTNGWLDLLLHARSDYFVFINIALIYLSTKISHLFSGSPLSLLPETIAFISFSFVSIVSTFTYSTTNKFLPFSFRILLFLMILLVPLGTTQSIVLGRVLQLGFYVPLLYTFLLFWRTNLEQKATIFFIDLILFFCAATNPVVIAFLFLYLVWNFYNEKNLFSVLKSNAELIFTHSFLFLLIFPGLIGSSGGVTNQYLWSNLIEAIIARPILYSFFFPWYSYLTDFISISFFCFWVYFVLCSYKFSSNLLAKRMILFLTGALLTCNLATIIMRPGLTTLLDHYQKSFPDYYFMGLNMLTMSLTIVASYQFVTSSKVINKVLGYGVFFGIIVTYLFNYSHLFLPINSSTNHLLFSDQLCLAKRLDRVSLASIKIYPSNTSWNMIVPTKFISNKHCSYDSFYDAGVTEKSDQYRMKPSEKLSAQMPITIKMTPRHKIEETSLKRIGVLFGCYGMKNTGLAELRLINTVKNTRFEIKFDLSQLVDNKYAYFDLDPSSYDSGEIVSVSGEGVSTWDSYNDKESYTCLIYEYSNGKTRFTPGCNSF